MDRYLGFSVRLPILGQGESGHCTLLSLPTQLWELKEHLVHPPSLPPILKIPADTLDSVLSGHNCPLGSSIDCFPVNDPIIYLVMLCSTTSMPQHCTGFRAAKSGEETCMILYDISYVQF